MRMYGRKPTGQKGAMAATVTTEGLEGLSQVLRRCPSCGQMKLRAMAVVDARTVDEGDVLNRPEQVTVTGMLGACPCGHFAMELS